MCHFFKNIIEESPVFKEYKKIVDKDGFFDKVGIDSDRRVLMQLEKFSSSTSYGSIK
jgi:hypothetical protein